MRAESAIAMEADMAMFESGDKEGMRKMIASMPGMVDHFIRQAIEFCWMEMPDERQNLQDVGAEVRRILERALRNLEEDQAAKRPPSPPPPPPAE
jgi:hypothetical protein